MKKPRSRASYRMVDEHDPHFARFWDAYPKRVSKKDARQAWAKLQPTPEMVDQMIETLAWQTPIWAKDGFTYAPYPASWLNAERWTDEPPPTVQRLMGAGAAAVFQTLGVKL